MDIVHIWKSFSFKENTWSKFTVTNGLRYHPIYTDARWKSGGQTWVKLSQGLFRQWR